MRLLFACIEGLTWPLPELPPFAALCLAQGAAGPLEGFRPGPDAWSLGDEPLWPALGRAGLKVGVMNLPGLWPAQEVAGFMVCRPPAGRSPGAWTHPPELALELGDYLPPQPLEPGAENWRTALKDTAYAQAAALARLRYEHFRRLCRARGVDLGALGWSALATARRLFGGQAGRAALMLAQLDTYLAWLHQALRPQVVVVCGPGREGEPGAILVHAPGLVRPGRLEPTDWQELPPALLALAGPVPAEGRGSLAARLLAGEEAE